MNKKFQEGITIQEDMKIKEHISVLKQKDGKNIGYSESERDGTTTSSYTSEHGDIDFKVEGNSPQGEQDTLHVGQILIKVLNNSGDNWSKPEIGDGVADCVAYDLNNNKKKIEIQIIRASTDQELWKRLATKGQINNERVPINEIISDIMITIKTKGNEQTIPSNIRQSITLALDANRLSAYTLDDIINKFHKTYGKEVKSFGFNSIWIVGPIEALTHRLDLLPEESEGSK